MSSDSEPPAQPQSALAPPQNTTSLQGRPAIPRASPASHPPPSNPSSTSINETSAPSSMSSISPPPAPAKRLKDMKTNAKKGRKKGKGQGLQAQEEAKRKQAEDVKALKEEQGFQRTKCEETVCAAEPSRREEGVQERKVERKESAEAADVTSPKAEVEIAPIGAALANAHAIRDITSVHYPEGIICTPAERNIHAKNGRFIPYVCRERPAPGRPISSEVLDYLDKRPEGAERRHAARMKAIQMRSPRASALSTSSAAPAGSKPSPAPSRA
ncbi:hypothetical protein K525DRAFT_285124 [Schizophyllum commune Loenen D]|nr:hypothetical protein K525DRAFT_285124 [Schizophyllum commune Loenen D]